MDRILPQTLATFRSSPNRGAQFAADRPDTIVIHYTAGASLASSVRTLCDPKSKASAHLVVGRDGSVVQLVELDVIAWHAGASQHGERVGLNAYSIGIEIDNPGRLTATAGGDFVTWFGRTVPKHAAIEAVHRNETASSWWSLYSEAQIERVFELTRLLVEGLGIKHVLGHEEIAPGRKSDPGPAFPLERLRSDVLGTGRNEDGSLEDETLTRGFVSASLLNVRRGPSTAAALAAPPLKRGTEVSIAGSQHGWLELRSPLHAWVKKEYVTLIPAESSDAGTRGSLAKAAGNGSPGQTP